MGFPWYSEVIDGVIDWTAVEQSFSKLKTESCCLLLNDKEIFVVDFEAMKFPNEDNWEEE